MASRELSRFIATWGIEAQQTIKLLRTLPEDQYDFRPDAAGRSLGELAWHLAEIDGFVSEGVVAGRFDFTQKLPGLERPRLLSEIVRGYERVHAESLARVSTLTVEQLDRNLDFMGREIRLGDILWMVLLHHAVHHRGQLALMCRLAGGTPPGLYGPTREEMEAMRKR